jgi:hypothetical protein
MSEAFRRKHRQTPANTGKHPTAELQETVSLVTENNFKNILSVVLISSQSPMKLYYAIILEIVMVSGSWSRFP